MFILQGIGDSGQGFVNAILFVALAKKVRVTLLSFVCCRKRVYNDETSQLIFDISQEQENLNPRENTPHIFTSSQASNNSDFEHTATYTDSYRSSVIFTA